MYTSILYNIINCHARVFCCLKKNLNAPRPSEHPPVRGKKCQNVIWVGSIALFLAFSALVANPKKKPILYTVTNPARGLLNREKKYR